jgi:TPR repeat protein
MVPMILAMLALTGCRNEAAEALLTCNGGNMNACYGEGLAAANAARPQYDQARKAWSASCMNIHHAESCNALALLVRDAKGGPRDLHRAAELFEIACKGEIKTSCVELGLLLYRDRDGLKADPAKAVTLLTDACKQVDEATMPKDGPHVMAPACDALGSAYLEGVGVEPPRKDEEKAAQLFDRACQAKYAPGCVSGGNILAKERQKNKVERASQLYETACGIDARQGCFELAQLHETKAWEGASDQAASKYFQKTCSIDPTRGCYEAGVLMETGRIKAREGEIESLFNLACEHGNSMACTKRKVQ